MYFLVMFERLFAENGLSLDRVRALLEVGATGSIVKAAAGDPVRQSQYSRQIKELEDFFQTKLVQRQGKGIRLTDNGKELARISRFFLLGLSNFKRGCLTEEQTFRVGANGTFLQCFLIPVLAEAKLVKSNVAYAIEILSDDEIERRLHDLRLDFGIVTKASLSRPLQATSIGTWRLVLWVPKGLHKTEKQALDALARKRLPLALASTEIPPSSFEGLRDHEPNLRCESFLQARAVLRGRALATVLPDFLTVEQPGSFLRIPFPPANTCESRYHLAWNPRLMRLNPQAVRRRDFLQKALMAGMKGQRAIT